MSKNEVREKRTSVQLSGVAQELWSKGSWGFNEKSQQLCDLVAMGFRLESIGLSKESLDTVIDSGLLQMIDSFYREGTTDSAKISLAQGVVSALLGQDKVYVPNSDTKGGEVEKVSAPESDAEDLIVSELNPMSFS